MDRYDHSIELTKSPEVVWAFTTDLERTPEWRTTITSIQPPGDLRVGERFSGTTRLLGRSWRWELRVTVVEPGRRFVYEVVRGVAKPSVEYHIEPLASGCRFTMSGWIENKNLAARVLMPFALRALNRETVRHLNNLRRVLETEA
jgi:uncharacterized protein YndB with AHSA1/START domain